jgi:hypothetical protein
MAGDAELRAQLVEAILGPQPEAAFDDPRSQLALVARVRDAESEVRALLQQSINSARSAGQSWSAIGETLGLSRQAVQQRFGKDGDSGRTAPEPDQRWLGPVTAFDEMRELKLAGELGWRTVEAKMFYHLVERTPTQWEHRRTVWSGPVKRLEKDGWEVAVLAFPWVYLVRDLGVPALEAEAEADAG